MKHILVTGAAGQIGVELVSALRLKYGNNNVVAAGHTTPIPSDLQANGPHTRIDVSDYKQIDRAIKEYEIDTVYHMSSILSALAEHRREVAYKVNFTGLYNLLEAGVSNKLERLVVPSSIAAFGPDTPSKETPNDTVQKPNTIYGISKVFSELMGAYYSTKCGLDVRGIRLPGILSWKVEPTAGTTDYAVAIFYGAILEGRYTCFLRPDSRLPMMYMPDAIESMVRLSCANAKYLTHHADYNVSAMSFTPSELAVAIRRRIPDFKIDYEIDSLRQTIADSWPDSLDDSLARQEWGWSPRYDLEATVDDMLGNLRQKLVLG